MAFSAVSSHAHSISSLQRKAIQNNNLAAPATTASTGTEKVTAQDDKHKIRGHATLIK